MPTIRQRTVWLATAVVALAIAGAYAFHRSPTTASQAQAAPAAAQVDAAEVIRRPIVDWQRYSGRLEAIDRVEIRPLVSGTLTAVHFRDGSLVEQGDPLFTIDPRPYEAAAARAEADVAAARARSAYTASELARARRLLADNAVARRDYEERQNAARGAAASLQAAEAALRAARLDLAHTQIVAPVAGRVSRAEITVGNVVSAGAQSAPLTTLVSVARMYASFDVDEQTFLSRIHPARSAGVEVPVELGLNNEDGYSRRGAVQYVDNRLDTASSTIRVRAVFDNADGALVPGLYARIRVGSSQTRDAILVSEQAIGTDQDKRYVLVLDDAGHARYREVRLGASMGRLRIVESGLEAGERIVVNGLQRVRPDDPVTPNIVAMEPAAPALRTASAAH